MNLRAAPREDGADRGKPGNGAARRHHAREPGVLSIKPFRRLWIALSLSSLGDWLSIVALTALAPSLATGGLAAKGSAVSGVWLATLLPALLIGPLAGALADRLDRRMTMIVGDVIRGLLFLSIPLFPNLTWIYVAKFLAGVASQFWNPATAASVPNLVPKDKLERANQLSLLTTYGTAPLAAGLFSVLALVSEGISRVTPLFHTSNVDLALYFNAASYFISALTVYFIREIPKRNASGKISVPSTFRSIWEGWRFIGKTPVVRGLVVGMVGAFAAAGVVVGLGFTYITYTLHGGSAGWGLVFAAIFVGMALGMGLGTKVLGNFSRRRLFGLTIAAAAVPLALIGLVPVLGAVVLFVVLIGALSGIAYATGFTIVGLEVDDDTRGRVFAFFQSSIQVILFTVIAVVPLLSYALTRVIVSLNGTGNVKIGNVTYASAGQNAVILLAAVVAFLLGMRAYRQMDDRKGVPLREDLRAAIRNEPLPPLEPGPPEREHPAGASAGRADRVRGRRGLGQDHPGPAGGHLAARARLRRGDHARARRDQDRHAAARAAAGHRAHRHVAARRGADVRGRPGRARRLGHRPALARGAIVITDRYVDSSLAYQGAGRDLPVDEIARLNRWATGGRTPDLTILLDMDPMAGLSRRARSADRLEAEPADFHLRVRAGFQALARAEPARYLVLDADRPPGQITREIQERVRELLPDPVPSVAEANTGDFPAIRHEVLTSPHRPDRRSS